MYILFFLINCNAKFYLFSDFAIIIKFIIIIIKIGKSLFFFFDSLKI